MADTPDRTTGIKLLIQNLKKEFRIPENLEYYSEEDFQEAEKKFLKFCLQNGCNLDSRDLSSNKGNDDLDLVQPVE
jgi:Holliday junction resolvasome RuvABC ATP-dependent DNA helicase subunit